MPDEVWRKYLRWALDNGYDHSKPHTWITYVDVTSLYPWAMTQPLPIGEYKEVPLPDKQHERITLFRKKLDTFTDTEA